MNKATCKSALFLVLMLLSILLVGIAFAESNERVVVWKVVDPEFDTETLLDETFDRKIVDKAPDIIEEQRDCDSLFWQLKGVDGLPFCGISHGSKTIGIQSWIDIYRRDDRGGQYDYHYNLDEWNSIPEESGFGSERAAETCSQAADLLKRLGLYGNHYEANAVSFTMLGSMEGATKCRKVVFEEILDGLPIRWSAEILYDGDDRMLAYRNYAEVIYSDEEGLLKMEGYWCAFEPAVTIAAILSPEAAAQQFASVGIKGTANPESCWFLSSNGKEATATLAYRVGNNYLSAIDGSWLQIEK